VYIFPDKGIAFHIKDGISTMDESVMDQITQPLTGLVRGKFNMLLLSANGERDQVKEKT